MERYRMTVVYDGGVVKEHVFEAEQKDVSRIGKIIELAFENGVNASVTIPDGKNSTTIINIRKVIECTFQKLVTKAD